MLNRDEEGSAQRVVPYLSHGTFARLEIWLRGHATNSIWTSPGRQHSLESAHFPSVLDRPLRHLSALESTVCERSGTV